MPEDYLLSNIALAYEFISLTTPSVSKDGRPIPIVLTADGLA
jgi:hypothetical protein